MRKILSIAFLCVSVAAFSQDTTIDKGSGIMYFSGVPGTTPDTTYGAEIAINKLTRELYVYNRDSTAWKKYSAYSQSYTDPSGDPTPGPYLHINRADGGLFQWSGAAWVEFGANTDDQTLSKPTADSISIESGNTIVDRSLMHELPLGDVTITTANDLDIVGTHSYPVNVRDATADNVTGISYKGAEYIGTNGDYAGFFEDRMYFGKTGADVTLEADGWTAPDLINAQLGNYDFNTDQDTTGLDGYVQTFNSSTGEIELQASSGSVETADGVTINGDGSGGSPFTVDTTLIATTQAVIDSIAALATGSVVGAASSTDNAIVRFDGVSGDTLQNSAVTISDAGAMTLNGGNIALNGEYLSGDGGDEGIYINPNGDVGINENNPENAKLHIYQNSNTSSATRLENQSNSTSFTSTFHLLALANYNQTDNNWAKFSFVGNTTSTDQATASIGARFTDHVNSYGNLVFWTRSAGGFSEKMIIEEGGDVGIGVSDPDQKLEVNGDIKATGGALILNDANDVFIQTNAGTPESVVTADPGSLVLDTSNGVTYIKNTGTGSTGWLPNATGASSSTDNAIVRFNGTGGTALQSSDATIDDLGQITTTGLTVEAETASTTGSASIASFRRYSTGNMSTTFGMNIPFYIGDNTLPSQQIAYFLISADGADDNGQISFATYNGGFPQTALRLDTDQNVELLQYDHNLKSGAAVSSDFAIPMLNANGTMYRFEVSNIIARMAGGSASFTSGTDESIAGDVAPSTAAEISGTSDWAISNDSLVYTGTETRFFSIIATVDGDGSAAGDYSFSIAKNGTVETASTITGTVLNANDKIDVMLLYGISLTTNDVIQIFVDVDAGSPTFTNENTIIKIEPFDN